jgi:hypothetical protein
MIERACLRLSLLTALWLLCLPGGAFAAAEVDPGLGAPYAVETSKQPLLTVLERFAADHGLTIRVAAHAGRPWQTTTLDGWVRAPSGLAFLEQLSRAHHFSWFVAERTLYLSAARDAAVERIALAGMPADRARAALEAVGVYDARFGWGELAGQDAVLVGGPQAYRTLVRRFLAKGSAPGETASELEPMIFPLRFVRAADEAPADSGVATRPGVAAILRQLLARETAVNPPLFAIPAQADFPPLPTAPPPASQWTAFPSATAASPLPLPLPRARASGESASQATEPSIVADEATNSVIVWGDRRWRSKIAQVVAALDRPSPLVSMDVLVIETDLATVAALDAASDGGQARATATAHGSAFDAQIAAAIAERRVRVLNRQTLVGRFNSHTTLAIGGEAPAASTAPDATSGEPHNGRGGNRGDRLDLAARLMPAQGNAAPNVAVDVDLLMAQPTGLPGQTWANTSSVKLDTAVTLESGAPPRLIASYPVASARAEQRAIFISAKAL